MSTYSKMAPLMDMPFLFRDIDHWNKVLDQGGLDPIAEDVKKKADVILIGYAGGGTRNLIVNKPVENMEDLNGLAIRVMGAPIKTKIFQALTAAPTDIAYSERSDEHRVGKECVSACRYRGWRNHEKKKKIS